MRWRDAEGRFTVPPAAHSSQSMAQAEKRVEDSEPGEQSGVVPPSLMYPSISTERIMQAVEQQRRISQQLEDLRTQQKQRTAFLRTTGLKCIVALCGIFSVLGSAFVILLFARPDLLERVLDALSGAIAALLVLEESVRRGGEQIPLSNWLLSGTALLVVLMMGLWVRLMRHPREG